MWSNFSHYNTPFRTLSVPMTDTRAPSDVFENPEP